MSRDEMYDARVAFLEATLTAEQRRRLDAMQVTAPISLGEEWCLEIIETLITNGLKAEAKLRAIAALRDELDERNLVGQQPWEVRMWVREKLDAILGGDK